MVRLEVVKILPGWTFVELIKHRVINPEQSSTKLLFRTRIACSVMVQLRIAQPDTSGGLLFDRTPGGIKGRIHQRSSLGVCVGD